MGFRSGYVALCAILLGWGAAAQAHELSCEQTLDGARVREVVQYPATLRYQFTVTNTHATDTSETLGTEDALLAPSGFRFTPAAPFSLPGGGSVSSGHTLTLNDEAECLALAAKDGRADRFIDNAFTVTWDMSATVCTTRAVCGSPAGEPPAPPACQPGQGATRGLGFWKTHVDAAAACLAQGPVDVGLATLTPMGDVEGLLWGSPARFADGTARGRPWPAPTARPSPPSARSWSASTGARSTPPFPEGRSARRTRGSRCASPRTPARPRVGRAPVGRRR